MHDQHVKGSWARLNGVHQPPQAWPVEHGAGHGIIHVDVRVVQRPPLPRDEGATLSLLVDDTLRVDRHVVLRGTLPLVDGRPHHLVTCSIIPVSLPFLFC